MNQVSGSTVKVVANHCVLSLSRPNFSPLDLPYTLPYISPMSACWIKNVQSWTKFWRWRLKIKECPLKVLVFNVWSSNSIVAHFQTRIFWIIFPICSLNGLFLGWSLVCKLLFKHDWVKKRKRKAIDQVHFI